MQEANLPEPTFVQKTSGVFQVSVTLRNNIEARKTFVRAEIQDVVSRAIFEALSPDEKLIINFLADRGSLNVTDTGLLIGKDWRATKAILDTLEEKKIVERTPGKERNRHRRYHLRRDLRA